MNKFKNFAVVLLASLISMTASAQTQNNDKYYENLANKYLEIAVIGAEGRLKSNLSCSEGTYSSEITQMTLKAIALARNSENSAFKVKFFASVKSNKALQKVVSDKVSYRYALATSTLGYGFAAVKSALQGSTMYGPAPGVYGNMSKVTFLNASQAKLYNLDMNDNGDVSWSSKVVSYSVSQNAEYQTIVTIDGKSYIYEENNEATLRPEGSEDSTDAYQNGFVEFPSECEA